MFKFSQFIILALILLAQPSALIIASEPAPTSQCRDCKDPANRGVILNADSLCESCANARQISGYVEPGSTAARAAAHPSSRSTKTCRGCKTSSNSTSDDDVCSLCIKAREDFLAQARMKGSNLLHAHLRTDYAFCPRNGWPNQDPLRLRHFYALSSAYKSSRGRDSVGGGGGRGHAAMASDVTTTSTAHSRSSSRPRSPSSTASADASARPTVVNPKCAYCEKTKTTNPFIKFGYSGDVYLCEPCFKKRATAAILSEPEMIEKRNVLKIIEYLEANNRKDDAQHLKDCENNDLTEFIKIYRAVRRSSANRRRSQSPSDYSSSSDSSNSSSDSKPLCSRCHCKIRGNIGRHSDGGPCCISLPDTRRCDIRQRRNRRRALASAVATASGAASATAAVTTGAASTPACSATTGAPSAEHSAPAAIGSSRSSSRSPANRGRSQSPLSECTARPPGGGPPRPTSSPAAAGATAVPASLYGRPSPPSAAGTDVEDPSSVTLKVTNWVMSALNLSDGLEKGTDEWRRRLLIFSKVRKIAFAAASKPPKAGETREENAFKAIKVYYERISNAYQAAAADACSDAATASRPSSPPVTIDDVDKDFLNLVATNLPKPIAKNLNTPHGAAHFAADLYAKILAFTVTVKINDFVGSSPKWKEAYSEYYRTGYHFAFQAAETASDNRRLAAMGALELNNKDTFIGAAHLSADKIAEIETNKHADSKTDCRKWYEDYIKTYNKIIGYAMFIANAWNPPTAQGRNRIDHTYVHTEHYLYQINAAASATGRRSPSPRSRSAAGGDGSSSASAAAASAAGHDTAPTPAHHQSTSPSAPKYPGDGTDGSGQDTSPASPSR